MARERDKIEQDKINIVVFSADAEHFPNMVPFFEIEAGFSPELAQYIQDHEESHWRVAVEELGQNFFNIPVIVCSDDTGVEALASVIFNASPERSPMETLKIVMAPKDPSEGDINLAKRCLKAMMR